MAKPTGRTVLVIFHERVLGGATLQLLQAVPVLQERGWSFVFWVDQPSELHDALRERGFEVQGRPRPVAYSGKTLRLPPGPARRLVAMPGYFRELARLVRLRSPAVVHANSLFSIAEATAARLAGARVLLHVHELVPAGRKGATARLAARLVARERVAVSQASAKTLGGDAGIRVVFEATAVPQRPVAVRPAPAPFVVGTVGPISRNKGSDVFVDAARLAGRERTDIEFRMVGALRDRLEPWWGAAVVRRARELGIHHAEWCDVAEELRRWDAFVLPSRVDAFPGAMLQAMALGLPVIGTRTGGIPEQVDGCGLLVEAGDPQGLAESIVALAGSSYERRSAMGSAARRRVMENFTVERQAAALDAAYRAVAG
jgi:glycosyltransferase involved in cell wall biosynthesis